MTDAYPDVILNQEQDTYADPLDRYKSDGEWAAGVRPAQIIEAVEDIEWLISNSAAGKPNLVCGFCGTSRQVRTYDEGVRWFRTHPCDGEGVPIEEWLAA